MVDQIMTFFFSHTDTDHRVSDDEEDTNRESICFRFSISASSVAGGEPSTIKKILVVMGVMYSTQSVSERNVCNRPSLNSVKKSSLSTDLNRLFGQSLKCFEHGRMGCGTDERNHSCPISSSSFLLIATDYVIVSSLIGIGQFQFRCIRLRTFLTISFEPFQQRHLND